MAAEIYFPKWMYVLRMCNNIHQAKIRKLTPFDYCFVHQIIKKFESCGWVLRTKNGRKMVISLTDKGKAVVDHCQIIMELK